MQMAHQPAVHTFTCYAIHTMLHRVAEMYMLLLPSTTPLLLDSCLQSLLRPVRNFEDISLDYGKQGSTMQISSEPATGGSERGVGPLREREHTTSACHVINLKNLV